MSQADLSSSQTAAFVYVAAPDERDSVDVSRQRSRGRDAQARLRSMVDLHFDFIWRSLRRLGVPLDAVDDATQRVFLVAAKNIDAIAAPREKSYLFGSALRVAADFRRVRARVREVAAVEALESAPDPSPAADELLDQKRAREILDTLLEEMPIELRTVLVLVEGEGLTGNEVAKLLALPEGTVNSRLRRAREALAQSVARLRKRSAHPRGTST